MIQKIKHTNLNQNCKLSKRADQLKEQVWLVFLMKESRIKTGTIVSDKFQFQLKKVLATAKFSTSVTNLPKGGNSWFFYPFKPFRYPRFCYDEMPFSWNIFCQSFSAIAFSLKQRSSRLRMLFKIEILKNFAIFLRKHL